MARLLAYGFGQERGGQWEGLGVDLQEWGDEDHKVNVGPSTALLRLPPPGRAYKLHDHPSPGRNHWTSRAPDTLHAAYPVLIAMIPHSSITVHETFPLARIYERPSYPIHARLKSRTFNYS